MTSLCGHVKALIREWAIERMGEKHQNQERQEIVSVFLSVHVCLLFLLGLCFLFLIVCQLKYPLSVS